MKKSAAMWTAAADQLYDASPLQDYFHKLLTKKHVGKDNRASKFKNDHVLKRVYEDLEEHFTDKENDARSSKNCTHRLLCDSLVAYKKAQTSAENKKQVAAGKKEVRNNACETAESCLGLKPPGRGNSDGEKSSAHLAILSVADQRAAVGGPASAMSLLAGAENAACAADAVVSEGRTKDALDILAKANVVSVPRASPCLLFHLSASVSKMTTPVAVCSSFDSECNQSRTQQSGAHHCFADSRLCTAARTHYFVVPSTWQISTSSGNCKCTKISKSEYLKRVQQASDDPLAVGDGTDKRKLEDSLMSSVDSLKDSIAQPEVKKQETVRNHLKDINESIDALTKTKDLCDKLGKEEQAKKLEQQILDLCPERIELAKELAKKVPATTNNSK